MKKRVLEEAKRGHIELQPNFKIRIGNFRSKQASFRKKTSCLNSIEGFCIQTYSDRCNSRSRTIACESYESSKGFL